LINPARLITDSSIGNNDLVVWDYLGATTGRDSPTSLPLTETIMGGPGIAVSPDRQRFAMACYLGIDIRDSTNLKQIHRWGAHSNIVNGVCFSTDGKTLVSSGLDGKLRFWDSKTFASKLCLTIPRVYAVDNLAFIGDGSAVCLLEGDRLHVWQIATKEEVKAARW
jgi:WD40 repeat protein